MKASALKTELELMMSRNLAILTKEIGKSELPHAEVAAMLRSIAANIAQAYAHRVEDEELCAKCGDPLEPTLSFLLPGGKRIHPGCF